MTATPLQVERFPARTVPALLWASAQRHPEREFLRIIDPAAPDAPPRTLRYGEFVRWIRSAAAWLKQRGVGRGDRVLFFAENSAEWQAFSLATTLLGAEPAAAASNLQGAQARDILARTAPKVVFVGSSAQWEMLRYEAAPRAVVSRERLDVDAVPEGAENATFAQALGTEPLDEAEAQRRVVEVTPDSVFLLIFTSGTTGKQKGVPVTQDAFVRALEGFRRCTRMTDQDLGLMFLPYAHIAGQAQFHLAHATGHTLIHVARRDDITRGFALGPTYTLSVPLIYERIVEGVERKLAGMPAVLRVTLRAALEAAGRVRCDGSTSPRDRLMTAVADRTLRKALQQNLGGNIRALFAGGAPTPAKLWRFFESLNIPYVQAYGMSETAAFISTTALGLPRDGESAGFLSPDLEARLMPDGELQVRGPIVFKGYLEAADDVGAFTEDGFFRTGDRAEQSPDGHLRLRGRAKNLIVLSTGKKVAPEPVEEQLASAAPINSAVVMGDGKPFVAAAVFVAPEELAALGTEPEKRVLELVQERLDAFAQYERPRRALIITGTLMDFPELLTPSFKLKRDAFFKKWEAQISELYASTQRPA